MKKLYRCSICGDWKKYKTNCIMRLWTQRTKPKETTLVGICRKCNNALNKTGLIGVQEYLEGWDL